MSSDTEAILSRKATSSDCIQQDQCRVPTIIIEEESLEYKKFQTAISSPEIINSSIKPGKMRRATAPVIFYSPNGSFSSPGSYSLLSRSQTPLMPHSVPFVDIQSGNYLPIIEEQSSEHAEKDYFDHRKVLSIPEHPVNTKGLIPHDPDGIAQLLGLSLDPHSSSSSLLNQKDNYSSLHTASSSNPHTASSTPRTVSSAQSGTSAAPKTLLMSSNSALPQSVSSSETHTTNPDEDSDPGPHIPTSRENGIPTSDHECVNSPQNFLELPSSQSDLHNSYSHCSGCISDHSDHHCEDYIPICEKFSQNIHDKESDDNSTASKFPPVLFLAQGSPSSVHDPFSLPKEEQIKRSAGDGADSSLFYREKRSVSDCGSAHVPSILGFHLDRKLSFCDGQSSSARLYLNPHWSVKGSSHTHHSHSHIVGRHQQQPPDGLLDMIGGVGEVSDFKTDRSEVSGLSSFLSSTSVSVRDGEEDQHEGHNITSISKPTSTARPFPKLSLFPAPSPLLSLPEFFLRSKEKGEHSHHLRDDRKTNGERKGDQDSGDRSNRSHKKSWRRRSKDSIRISGITKSADSLDISSTGGSSVSSSVDAAAKDSCVKFSKMEILNVVQSMMKRQVSHNKKEEEEEEYEVVDLNEDEQDASPDFFISKTCSIPSFKRHSFDSRLYSAPYISQTKPVSSRDVISTYSTPREDASMGESVEDDDERIGYGSRDYRDGSHSSTSETFVLNRIDGAITSSSTTDTEGEEEGRSQILERGRREGCSHIKEEEEEEESADYGEEGNIEDFLNQMNPEEEAKWMERMRERHSGRGRKDETAQHRHESDITRDENDIQHEKKEEE
ncbi:hypothetical protein ADUPG1_013426 [Aduncisulcus paluster]|uniref:Uncharacterized protein n=1 Tax=Aduncisulcus paluster TaxID=2918883 RepID=A0ABQ5K3F6_9EUKA|nr:hypothetical protein ADUPG1_013426 [Aduncisulcus paluster]